MRTPEQTAEYMMQRYGKDAAIHCSYIIMNNDDNATARNYWRAVYDLIKPVKKKG